MFNKVNSIPHCKLWLASFVTYILPFLHCALLNLAMKVHFYKDTSNAVYLKLNIRILTFRNKIILILILILMCKKKHVSSVKEYGICCIIKKKINFNGYTKSLRHITLKKSIPRKMAGNSFSTTQLTTRFPRFSFHWLIALSSQSCSAVLFPVSLR